MYNAEPHKGASPGDTSRPSQRDRLSAGFAFALPGDYLNAASFVARRWEAGGATLSEWELSAVGRLCASPDLLGLAAILRPERASALRSRAARMLARGRLLEPGDF